MTLVSGVIREPALVRTRRATLLAILGLAGVIAVSVMPLGKWISPGSTIAAMLGREAAWWIYAVAVLVWLRFGERLPIRSIGFRRITWRTFAFGLLATVATVIAMTAHFAVIIPILHLNPSAELAARRAILATPYWFRVLLVLRASVVEEILWRGYFIEKVKQLTGSMWLAVLFSAAAFTYAHLSGWGAVHLIPVAASGIVFALLYAWRRDLPSNMFGHFLTDAAGFLTS